MITRFKEHTDVRKPTVMRCDEKQSHNVTFDDVEVIEQGKTDKKLLIKENLTVRDSNHLYNVDTYFFFSFRDFLMFHFLLLS